MPLLSIRPKDAKCDSSGQRPEMRTQCNVLIWCSSSRAKGANGLTQCDVLIWCISSHAKGANGLIQCDILS